MVKAVEKADVTQMCTIYAGQKKQKPTNIALQVNRSDFHLQGIMKAYKKRQEAIALTALDRELLHR